MESVDLYFREFGEGKPLVILHGVFGSGDNWITPGKKLAEKYHVYLLDQRNHGRSPWAEPHSYEAMAADLKRFLDTQNLSDIHLIGHSMGGKTALKFALNYPEYLNQLIVVDIGPKLIPIRHDTILETLCALPVDKISSRTEAEKFLEKNIPSWAVRQFLLKNLQRGENKKWEWRINLELIKNSISQVGEAIWPEDEMTIPTMFIRGGNSDYILDDDVDEIRKKYIFSTVETIPNAGHWVHAEQMDLFLDTVHQFLM